jgi:hypothetical protein
MCEDWENCECRSHVKPWGLVKLKPLNIHFACTVMDEHDREEDWEFGGKHGVLGDVFVIGDNFAVPVEVDNEDGVDFYILQCQRPRFVVTEPFECIWGSTFHACDFTVAGTYYQRWGHSNKTYVYLSELRIAYVSADLVKACKFIMRPATYRVKGDEPIYKMSEDTPSMIKSSIEGLNS